MRAKRRKPPASTGGFHTNGGDAHGASIAGKRVAKKRVNKLVYALLENFPTEASQIAALIAEWNMIEAGTHSILAFLLNTSTDHARALLSAVVSSNARLEVLKAAGLIELKGNDSLLDEFNEIIRNLDRCRKTRNRYAHGIYVVNGKKKLCILHPGCNIPPGPKDQTVIHSHVLFLQQEFALGCDIQLAKFHHKLVSWRYEGRP